MKLGEFLKGLVSPHRSSKDERRVTLVGVSHDVGNEVIGQRAAEMARGDQRVLVEGSLYLGGFLPADASREKILVMMEPPTLFTKGGADHPSSLYVGGRAIPPAGRGPRRMFETIAHDLEKGLDRRAALRTVYDLLYLRGKAPDVVVYNEPQAWLRTVWYESDLLFHYMLCQRDHSLFGAFIYSDMDAGFAAFLERYGNALSAMTGDDCLLFTFDGRGGRDSDLNAASKYVSYRAVLETPSRFEGTLTAAELDSLREREARMLADVIGVNRSLLFGRRLGVRVDETPCLVFWRSLQEKRIVTVPLAPYTDDGARTEAMKTLAGTVANAVARPGGDVLSALEQGMGPLVRQPLAQPRESVGDVIRAFLQENTPPLRDRLMIEDIDNFERVRAVAPADVTRFLSRDGYLDLPEDDVQRALEDILSVPFHKKDWGGEVNDLYAANVLVNGARIPTAFLLKGNGLRRAEMRIADCGKNGDQLLRLFESPAYLFVVQFVGHISEAVIADVQGKVALRRAKGTPAWFLVIDGQDTARLMHAHDRLR